VHGIECQNHLSLRTLPTFAGDDTVKLWDIRAIKKPVNVVGNLENVFPMTTCAFSPDDQIIATGTSVKPGEVCIL
jgi:WD40 repeat protein